MPRSGSTQKVRARRTSAPNSSIRAGSSGVVFNRREVADFAGVSLQTIDKAIEQGIVPRRRQRAETLISEDGLVVMAIIGHAKFDLPVKVKHQVRRWISQERPFAKKGEQTLRVSDVITVHLSEPVREVVAEAEEYAADRDRFIESNPHIFGGQPVIAGTRIPVRTVAERLEKGDTIDVLRDDYPHVDPRAFDVAARYAKTHPRRGRPAKPWLDGTSRRTSRA